MSRFIDIITKPRISKKEGMWVIKHSSLDYEWKAWNHEGPQELWRKWANNNIYELSLDVYCRLIALNGEAQERINNLIRNNDGI